MNTSSVAGFWASLGPGRPNTAYSAANADARDRLVRAGVLSTDAPPEELRRLLARMERDLRDKAPLTPAAAATIMLDGVQAGAWWILVGEGADALDVAVRATPEMAYDYAALGRLRGS